MSTTVRTRCALDAFVHCGPYTALDQLGVTCSDVRTASLVVQVLFFLSVFECNFCCQIHVIDQYMSSSRRIQVQQSEKDLAALRVFFSAIYAIVRPSVRPSVRLSVCLHVCLLSVVYLSSVTFVHPT